MKKLAIFASHNGTVLDAIYNEINNNRLDATLALIITNNSNAPVIQKAIEKNIPYFIVNDKLCEDPDATLEILLQKYECELVLLAGYMKKLSTSLTKKYKIINSHPALLPKYGGKGMYGRFIHEAVLKNREKISGVTVHEVDENYDEGKIILQKSITLDKDESVESLEKKIKLLEQSAVVEALKAYLNK